MGTKYTDKVAQCWDISGLPGVCKWCVQQLEQWWMPGQIRNHATLTSTLQAGTVMNPSSQFIKK